MVRVVACCFLLSVAALNAKAQQTRAVTNNNSVVAAISVTNARQPTVLQDTNGSSSATEQSLASPPPAGKALVYVYRQGHIVGAGVHPLIFVNDSFLAVLKNSNYAEREVPQGTVVVAATVALEHTEPGSAYVGLSQYFPPTLRWPKCLGDPRKPSCTWDAAGQTPEKEEHGCAKVDWRRVDEARHEDSALCRKELSTTSAALDNWLDPNRKSRELLLGMLVPGALGNVLLMDAASGPKGDLSAWLQMCGPNPFPQRSSQEVDKIRSDLKRGDYSDEWSRCKNEAAAADLMLQVKERLRIEAEAGKTYYVEWSVSGSGGKMKFVDAATGAKKISNLHLAKD